MGKCLNCGGPIPEGKLRRKAMRCSSKCVREHDKKRWRANNPTPAISKGNKGAISEMAVVMDLLQKGYHVFRSVSPACPIDLMVLKNGNLVKVEVKTGYYTVGGELRWPTIKNDEFDVLAVVAHGEIFYRPELTEYEVYGQ